MESRDEIMKKADKAMWKAITVVAIFIAVIILVDKNNSNKNVISNNIALKNVNEQEIIQGTQSNILENTTLESGSGIYTGDVIDGMKHDVSGKFEFTNGVIYEGQFVHNQIEGNGKLTIPNLGVYIGNFSNGKRNGNGEMIFTNDDTYVGEWQDDKMSGNGTYTFSNGDSYVGEFSDNKFNGQGTYTLKNGKSYTGKWINNSYKG